METSTRFTSVVEKVEVNLSSEKITREVVKEWVGEGVRCEEVPAMVVRDKKTFIELRPWSYLYNLVGYVLKYLDDLQSNDLLHKHQFIPDNEIHLKIGGDHGGNSFKISFQIGNAEHPNQPQNIVIFSILEAKDYKMNLMLSLERFKLHVAKFSQIRWSVKNFRIFLFGDYEFLANMYGISGAGGRHPCLWCHITSDMMKVPISMRLNQFPLRTLDSLKKNLNDYHQIYNSDLKYAKNVFNVINDVLCDVPLEQVCLPGLH